MARSARTIEHSDPHIARVDRRLTEIAKEYRVKPMPEQIRAEWNALNTERDERFQRNWRIRQPPQGRIDDRR